MLYSLLSIFSVSDFQSLPRKQERHRKTQRLAPPRLTKFTRFWVRAKVYFSFTSLYALYIMVGMFGEILSLHLRIDTAIRGKARSEREPDTQTSNVIVPMPPSSSPSSSRKHQVRRTSRPL